MIVDVREPFEYADSHVEGAVNIPLGEVQDRMAEIPKDEEVIVYCRSGVRAGNAVQILQSAGYSNVVNGINQAHVEETHGSI